MSEAPKGLPKTQAIKNLRDVQAIMDRHGVPIMLDAGTLLGAYRDGDFCDGDHDDVDVTTSHLFVSWIPQILAAAEAIGFKTVHSWPRQPYQGKQIQSAQIAIKRGGSKIDVMFKEIEEPWAWWTVFKPMNRGVVYKLVPSRHYVGCDSLLFYGQEFMIPADVEAYLTLRYGDWRTPVHRRNYSCYTSDKTIVRGGYQELRKAMESGHA